ncbi:MAG TPA: glycosyltransferase family 4 protein [Bryobacteraceae bacterium]|nr:glycosyltransferase family 4 protein [Bryobacteraceae bacterium]
MRVLLAHPGTQYAPRLAVELHRHGVLQRFATGIAVAEDGALGALDRLMPAALRRRWANRRIRGVPASELRLFPSLEWRALRRLRRGDPAEAVFRERNEAFQRAIPDRWIVEATHVIGFDTSSWILAERCRRFGRPFILDQSIGHPCAKEQVYEELRRRFPSWADSVPEKSVSDLSLEALEHDLATLVVVPSGFVRDTFVAHGVDERRIRVNPFGTDLAEFAPGTGHTNGPLVFLFAGSLTARKGLPILLEAWTAACMGGKAQLWIAGPGKWPLGVGCPPDIRLLGGLSRSALVEAMRQADVFVFPSYFEGLAQVQVEALAVGLPVIGTTASGAEEIVHDQESGYVVQTGDVAELATRLRYIVEHPVELARMRQYCMATRDRLSLSAYGDRWLKILQSAPRLPSDPCLL